LAWDNVDFDNQVITIRAFNTKTMRQRQVAMTNLVTRELYTLYDLSTKQPGALVFGITPARVMSLIKRGFSPICPSWKLSIKAA
jgi:hypothetical protein